MLFGKKSTPEEKERFSLLKILATLFSLIMIRLFLENFVYPEPSGYFFPSERFIHAILYFSSLFLSLSILIYLFTKDSFENIATFMIKVFLFILSVPLIDFLFNKLSPDKAAMAYLIKSPEELLRTFFDVINFFNGQGITFGQHVASLSILLAMAFFVYKKTNRVAKTIFLVLCIYATLFFYEMLPSFMLMFTDNGLHSDQNALATYYSILNQSWMSSYTESSSFLEKVFLQTETVHELVMAKFFFLSLVLQAGVLFALTNKRIWNALKQDLKLERIFYWFIIATIGIIINAKIFGDLELQNPINIVSLLVFFILIALNGWLASLINDAEDIGIDSISNPNRPLIAKTVSPHDWNMLQIILLLLIIIGLSTMSKVTISLFILVQALYYIYSVKPLRLKSHFITSSIIIGLSSIGTAMAGFYLVSPDQHIGAFPIKAIFIIGIAYALISNLKDIKDFEGDKHEGILTMPVVFGLMNAKYIIATLYAIVLIIVPLLLNLYVLFFPSVCIALFISYLFTKKKYQEKYIFLAFFLYLLIFFLAIL